MTFPLIVVALVAVTAGLPALSLLWLWLNKSKIEWLRVLVAGEMLLFVWLAGAWSFLSHFLKYAYLVLFVFIIIKSSSNVRLIFSQTNRSDGVSTAIKIFLLASVTFLNYSVIKGYFYKGEALALALPLKGGSFSVIQGGSTRIINPFHRGDPSARYAIDLVKLNAYGNRASGLFPNGIKDYAIFGATLYSPCEGKVIIKRDGLPDNVPGVVDKENPAGNHVVVDCGAEVMLAHLEMGSVRVKEGDYVKTGYPIGRVGNSGNSLEPHLHLHASRAGASGPVPVPVTFNGSFPALNDIYSN